MIDRQTRLRIFDRVGLVGAGLTGIGILGFGLPPVLAFLVPFFGILVLGAVVESFDDQDGIGGRWLRARRQARGD
jgi:hypothetical protein